MRSQFRKTYKLNRMKKSVLFSLISFLCLCFIVSSCKKEAVKFSGQAQFAVSLTDFKSSLKSGVADTVNLSYVLFTIEDVSGNVVKNSEKVELYNMNGDYISKPVSLVKGSYKLTGFMVLDSKNNIVYASPLKGSAKAYLVQEPLPISFDILRNGVTKLTPEVISTVNCKPEDFGYVTFGLDIVKTFDFLIGTFVYNDTVKNFELTSASISIFSDTTSIYSGQLNAIQNGSSAIVSIYDSIGVTNKITLSEKYSNYTLVISKNGYKTYRQTFTKEELKLHFKSTDKGPLIVILENFSMDNGLIAYYPFNGNANDESGNGHHGVNVRALLTSDRHGVADKAYSFNALNSYIIVRGFGNAIPTQEITVSIWAKTVDDRSQIAMMLTPDDNRFAVSINYLHTSGNNNFWDFGWRHEAGNSPGRLYFLESFDAAWHHYVFISSIAQNVMKIYKDGVLRATKSEPLILLSPENRDLKIGSGDNANYFNGCLDEIRIYNKILTEGEILSLFQN
jgi:Concanavalin A-like lectin/glucanases superfamily